MSSSSEDSDAGPKRKRKLRRLEDSSASTSSGSPIIRKAELRRKWIHKVNTGSTDSSSSSGSPIIGGPRRKIARVTTDSDSDSSDESQIVSRTHPGKPRRLLSDSDIDSDDSFISQWESGFSEHEAETAEPAVQKDGGESDSSDGQSEKCPICLVSFKTQEIGTPECCDHTFCLECIQEWSKNMNTCPVDRQEYSLILVRDCLNGKVVRQIPIECPTPQNEVDIIEDPTFCEICGSNEHEDRMLLCDGCDLGFHLFCLSPPLDNVPVGLWFCSACGPYHFGRNDSEEEDFEVSFFGDESRSRRRIMLRLIPRTQQSERVLRRIENNRTRNSPSTTLSPVNSRNTRLVTSSTPKKTRRKKKSKSRKSSRRVKYRTVYVIDEKTGETVARKKRAPSRRKRKTRRKERSITKPKTVKKRLAQQLGICAPRTTNQNLPDVKIPNCQTNPSNNISGMRHSAGIPALHLFGQNNELDYFSEEEETYSVGSQILTRRAPNHSDISAMRRTMRRKNIAITNVVSSSTDLLDSILNSQEQFYARNASYSLDSSGKFKVDTKDSKKSEYIDVTKEQAVAKESPYYPNNRNYNNRYNQNNYRYNQNRYQNNQRQNNYYHSNNQNYYHSEPSSSNYSNYSGDDNDTPQDYSQRTLCATSPDTEEPDEASNNPNSESELDIYSDIETVTTSKAEDSDQKQPSPPVMSNNAATDEDNDSETDMVIDDEKIQEQEYNKEEAAVSSTVGHHFEPSTNIDNSMEIQSEAVQSSSVDDNKSFQYYQEDSFEGCPNASVYTREVDAQNDEEAEESDDGCPNFSIYSKESKTLALHTDITLQSDYQVGEISSSPNIAENSTLESYDPEQIFEPTEEQPQISEPANDPDQTYDPEKIYDSPTFNPDKTYDPESCIQDDQSYDPEKIYDESSSNDVTVDYEKEVYKFASSEPNSYSDLDKSDIPGDRYDPAVPFNEDLDETEQLENNEPEEKKETSKPMIKGGILGGLYSDSEDDSIVKKDSNGFELSDINHMTEDISEEERSYTPCLDEKSQKQGLEGLDTEMISDEDRNDFDESHEKTVYDGDALEINAKESELDFTRPEDYEEGEIVDKNKEKQLAENDEAEPEEENTTKGTLERSAEEKKTKKKEEEKEKTEEKGGNKENENSNKDSSFKKLSKNNKERNYRDKDKRRSKSKERDSRKDKKKEKRKELERYNVRAIIADKPRPLIAKDQFGRDIRNTPSRSRSRSYTPPIRRSSSRPIRSPSKSPRSRRSLSRRHRSLSKEKSRKRRKSKNYSRSRSRSPAKKGPGSKNKKRKRSSSRFRKRKSRDRTKSKKRVSSGSRRRSRSPLRMQREWERWSPASDSLTPPQMSPSWTPPRLMDNSQLLRNENLTVTVNNSSKKKKERRKKGDKRSRENLETRQKRRRHERDRTPPPSKEVFASGDNILVSVSFNNENEVRDITTRDKRKNDENKRKKKRKNNANKKDLSGVKPVAIIDLERSPFRELTPSPKQIIVLTDSENEDNGNVQDNICDSSQQVASPERGIGPKTPPEPQVKFSLNAKQTQVRAISNPLHDPEDIETNETAEDEGIHIGPNTPPDPPNSPPSSPDAYDPFEPTKSRSPTPNRQPQLNNQESADSRSVDLEKSANSAPEVAKSLTPPLADIQPADSQSSIQVTPDSNLDKSPDRSAQVVQQSKPVAQTTPFSSVPTSIITSTPISSNIPTSRINILNSTVITAPVSSIPQRIVLPNQVKPSPVKISPTKTVVKSTPIKPITKYKVTRKRVQNGSNDDVIMDFDSPYSPGSSDYEDLFEPPSEIVTKPVIKKTSKSPQKHSSAFDALFGSPIFNLKQKNKAKTAKKNVSSGKTKTVGVKLDEDNLKILDDLPNSAVEMQVKDKFLKKLNRQERVVEEVKLVLKPHYNKKKINKEEYKDILRRSVPKICHNKSGEINPTKIKNLIEAYVRKIRHSKKVTSSSSVNPQKV